MIAIRFLKFHNSDPRSQVFLSLYAQGEARPTYSEQIFNSTVRVVESSTHGTVDIASNKSHGLHLSYGTLSSSTHGKRRRVSKGSRIISRLSRTFGRGWGRWDSRS